MTKSKEKIKIAFFLPNLDAGGAEKITINLLKKINKKDFDVNLVLGEKRGNFVKEVPREISTIELKTSSLIFLIIKITRYLKKEKPDIFVSIFPRFNIANIIAKIFSGQKTKIIIAEHTTFSRVPLTAKTHLRRFAARFFFPYLMKIFYPGVQAIICVSKGVANDLLKIVNIPQKLKIIYNPIIREQIYSLAKEPVEHPWFLDTTNPIIISVGRLVKAKDYPTLLKAFAIVLQHYPSRLVILGEGEERDKLEKLSGQLNISENISFFGFQENPYKYLSKATVFVLSSLQEGFATVIIEAMACGIPVVSTDCPSGPSEIIKDGENGFLVPMQHPETLAEALILLLENPPLRQKFSERSKIVIQDFLIEKSTKKYEELFRSVI